MNSRDRRRLPTPDEASQRYEHGTRARYVLGKCRCFTCKVANSEYVGAQNAVREMPYRCRWIRMTQTFTVVKKFGNVIVFRTQDREEAQRRKDELNRGYGKSDPAQVVGTSKVCKHIAWLKTRGVGLNAIARQTGLMRGDITRIARGKQKTRRANIEKILEVTPDNALPGAAIIDARKTWELLDELVAAGHSKTSLARRLGFKCPALQFRRDRVVLSTAIKVRKLYDHLTSDAAKAVAAAAPPTPQQLLARYLDRMDVDEFAVRIERLLRDIERPQESIAA